MMWNTKALAQRWPELRAAGRRNFLVRYGILRWGMTVSTALIAVMFSIEPHTAVARRIVLILIVGLTLGLVWALSVWRTLSARSPADDVNTK